MRKSARKLLVPVVALLGLALAACGEKYKSVEAYVQSEEVQEVVESLESQLEDSGVDITITAEGDKMVYTYTYETLENADGMADALASAVETQEDTFQETADRIGEMVKTKNPTLVIRYLDSSGELIYSKEYTAQ
jgi:uncharacterized lipoprotein YehR (DUF1307 family)